MGKYKIFDYSFFIDGSTGAYSSNLGEEILIKKYSVNYDSLNFTFNDYQTKSITFCLSLSDRCNLRCKYCFNDKKYSKKITEEEVFAFLNACFSKFPYKNRYIIDLSGKGEPLLNIPMILKIRKYANKMQDKLNREIVVQFISNGMCLDPIVIDLLQKNNILFGISLDGDKKIHDKNRVDKDGNPTFDKIMKNVKLIKEREFLGVGVTIGNEIFDLLNAVLFLDKYFSTISIKPLRFCDCSFNIESSIKWNIQYDILIKHIYCLCLKNDFKIIKKMLNGDDYFGKFLKRIFLKQRVKVRCDGGLSRICLDTNKNIYTCPAAFGYDELKIGFFTNFFDSKRKEILDKQLLLQNECFNCDFRHICGGECMVESLLVSGCNKALCIFKRHLIKLAIWFAESLKEFNINGFYYLLCFCREVDGRDELDSDLINFIKKENTTFTKGKANYDAILRRKIW